MTLDLGETNVGWNKDLWSKMYKIGLLWGNFENVLFVIQILNETYLTIPKIKKNVYLEKLLQNDGMLKCLEI